MAPEHDWTGVVVALASRRRDGATFGLLHRRRHCRDGSQDARCVENIGGRAALPVVGVRFGGSNVVVVRVLVEPHRDPPTRGPGLGRAGELYLLGTSSSIESPPSSAYVCFAGTEGVVVLVEARTRLRERLGEPQHRRDNTLVPDADHLWFYLFVWSQEYY